MIAALLALLAWGCGAPGEQVRASEGEESSPLVAAVFPLRASSNGRYLIDGNGAPFRVQGDAAWSASTDLTRAEWQTFLDDRKAKGFNTVLVQMTNTTKYSASSPAPGARGANGALPFLRNAAGGTWDGDPNFRNFDADFSSPNPEYFAWIDTLLNDAKARGILVVLTPCYLGYDNGATGGWWRTLTNSVNTDAVNFAFGQYLGNRYKGFGNILWEAGVDMLPAAGSTGERRLHKILEGIQAAGDTQLWTGHWQGDYLSTDQAAFAPDMDVQGIYTSGNYEAARLGPTYGRSRVGYSHQPPLPTILLETTYEGEHNATPQFVRSWMWGAQLSAIGGVIFGNRPLWLFDTGWQAAMNSTGSRDVQRMGAMLDTVAWHTLVPSGLAGMRTLVTAGTGTYTTMAKPGDTEVGGDDWVVSAANPAGTLLLAYVPDLHTGPFTIDMSALSGSVRARWFDPTNGNYTLIGTFANSGGRSFSIPTANSSGAKDWVLVLDVASGTSSAPPTVATAAAASPRPVTGTTTSASVLGADDGGESSLTYTWAAIGTPPAAVGFSPNGTNAAKNSTATFARAGSYTLQATISDAQGQSVTSTVSVEVSQTFTSIAATPASAVVAPNATQQFTASARDQFALALAAQPSFGWSVSGGGSVSQSGLFTAAASAGGPFTLSATAAGKTGTASVSVGSGISAKINFQTASSVTPSGYQPDTGSVYGNRGNGLSYGWNNDNGAQARERNAASSPDKRYDTFNHLQNSANPNAVWEIAVPNGSYRVRIVAGDPNFSDSVFALRAENVVVASGTPTGAQPWVDGTATVGVSDGRLTVSSASGATNNKINFIEISPASAGAGAANSAPTVATAASATPSPVSSTTTTLSALGADDGGEQALTYTWATTGTPPAAVGFSANGTNAAKNATATFGKAGAYTLAVTIRDANGGSVTSVVNVTVNQTLTSIAVTPSTTTVGANSTQQFSASATDQFGAAVAGSFTWSVSGGGTISTSGLFTAGGSAGGPFSVSATSGGRTGSASVSVSSGSTASSFKITFQTPTTATPAGYLADAGRPFGDRGGGVSYGWNNDNTAQARERNAWNSPNKLYDSFNHLQNPSNPNAFWEVALPNGSYRVRVVAGDPSFNDSVFGLRAESTVVVSGSPGAALWLDNTATVTVSDGRLTLSSTASASNNKINFIEISPATSAKLLSPSQELDLGEELFRPVTGDQDAFLAPLLEREFARPE